MPATIILYKLFVSVVFLTEMTFPSADSDLLMLAPSFSLSPVAPVESARSDPATNVLCK